jgi:FixJ family two-component response regulator
MFQRTLPSVAIVVCVVNEDASALKSTTEVLSTGYGIRPFRDGDTFLNVEEQMPPAWQLPHAYW